MAEYIEREAAVKAFNNFDAGRADSPPFTLLTPEEFAEYLYELPAADVAPVVRCKDCKWFADNNGGKWYGCQMFQVVRNTPEGAPKPDDFCSYGERKDGGADHDA